MKFLRFLSVRLLITVLSLFSATALIYGLMNLAPGSPLAEGANRDASLTYTQWLLGDSEDYRGAVNGDYGISLVTRRPVYESFLERLPATWELFGMAVLQSLLIGIPFGVLMAGLRYWLTDGFLRPLAWLGASTPIFWLAGMLLLIYAIEARAFPVGGRCPITISDTCPPLAERMEYLTLPLSSLSLVWGSVVALTIRRAILNRIAEDASGKLKGGHILQGVLLPVVGGLPSLFAGIFSSLLLVETIFAWPGVARQVVTAAMQRDYPFMVAAATMITVWIIVSYFVFSLFQGLLALLFGHTERETASPETTETALTPARRIIDRVYTAVAVLAALVFLGIYVVSAVPSLVASADPLESSMTERLVPPNSGNHPFGTDQLGRDMSARLLAGGQTTLNIALAASLIAIVIGGVVGIVAGLLGDGIGDLVYFPFNWLTVTLLVFPLLLLLVFVSAFVAPGVSIPVLGVIGATLVAPVFRARARAARTGEKGNALWGWLGALVYSLATAMQFAILAETGLSFLGLGVQPPEASWGNLLSNAQQYMMNASYLVIIPGLVIVTACFCLRVVASRIQDRFDFLRAV
jgi:ABC-type dipeptide/oligopeptide/nickel transport system permease subunit/ABC-type dipeptide/oligopeptide/nickel transport system permease component